MVQQSTLRAERFVERNFEEMVARVRKVATVMSAIYGGPSETSRIAIAKEGTTLEQIEAVVLHELLYRPIYVADEGTHWLIVGDMLWHYRLPTGYTKARTDELSDGAIEYYTAITPDERPDGEKRSVYDEI